jgi:hypothetical protein
MLSYQIGWMGLIQSWDADELVGKDVVTPAAGLKWNQLGALYHSFTEECQAYTLAQLKTMFNSSVQDFIDWFMSFSDEEVFQPGGRKWASSTPSNWPIWKWVHMNTVAPFKSFRSKIRKWKKLRGEVSTND